MFARPHKLKFVGIFLLALSKEYATLNT